MKLDDGPPRVGACKLTRCAFNRDQACHARAITIGDGLMPRCDTVFELDAHVRRGQVAAVGACKTIACIHNHDLHCQV